MEQVERDAYIRRIQSLECQLWIARHLATVARGNARRVEREAARRERREVESERRN